MNQPALACPKVACRVIGVTGLLTLIGFQFNGCGGDEFTANSSLGGTAQDASPDRAAQADASGSGGVALGGAAGTSQGGKAGAAGSGGIAGGGSGGTSAGGTTGSGGASGSGGVVGGSAGASGSGAVGGASGTGGESGAAGTSGNGGTSGEGGTGGSTGGAAGKGGVGGGPGGAAGKGGVGGGTAVPCGSGYQCLHVAAPTDWSLAGDLSGNSSSSCTSGPLVYEAAELGPMIFGTSFCKWTCSPPTDAGCSSLVHCSSGATCEEPPTQKGPVTAECTPFGGGSLYYCHAEPPLPLAECTPSTAFPTPQPPLPSSQFACLQPVSPCAGSVLGICVPNGSNCVAATGNTAPSCPFGYTLTEYYWQVADQRVCPQATCETLCTDQMGTGAINIYADTSCTSLQSKSIPVDGNCVEAGTISALNLPYDAVCKTQQGSNNASGTISGTQIHICCKP